MAEPKFKPGDFVYPRFRATIKESIYTGFRWFYSIESGHHRLIVPEQQLSRNDGIVPSGPRLELGARVHIANMVDAGAGAGTVVARMSGVTRMRGMTGRLVPYSCPMVLVRVPAKDGTMQEYVVPEAHCIAAGGDDNT